MSVVWDVMSCSVVAIVHNFEAVTFLWNIGKLIPDHTVSHVNLLENLDSYTFFSMPLQQRHV
jgi:hypothetical protein